jgi:regulator of protease activity HflC (stomatin/prohibitin superfamily)
MKSFAQFTCVASLIVLSAGCLPYTTDSEQVAVITHKGIIGGKGVSNEVQPKGTTRFLVPFLTDWHAFDVSLQNLEMTQALGRGDRRGVDDLTFKTIDGNDVSLDIIINYEIIADRAPYILQNVATNNEELKDNIVRSLARSIPRDLFGELNTEAFYDATERGEKAEEVKEKLNKMMEPYGVRVMAVSPKDYRFSDEYQQAIEDKKIADQQVEKNQAEAKAKEEEYLRKVEEEKGEVAKIKAQADGDFERAKIEADAYYDQQKLIAQAIEAEGKAEAEGILKMNEALSGAGGENMVKIAIADAMKGKRIMLIPIGGGGLDVRSTDINALLQLYGIQKVAQPQSTPPRPQTTTSPVTKPPAPPTRPNSGTPQTRPRGNR